MTKIKICGLTRESDIEAVNEANPDYVGFVFAESKRRITPQAAFELRKRLNATIQTVGVFVDESIEQIIKLCLDGIIDTVQLHGHENAVYIQRLQEKLSKPVIKAVRVRSEKDIKVEEASNCNYLLLDAYSDKSAGGTGETFDWNVIDRVEKPFFLAGGLNSSNILQAIRTVKPFGVDISSGVETAGFKDRDKILEIVTLIRAKQGQKQGDRLTVSREL
ncbi:phosphoribosylanthranilate isomerase [Desulfosporosinus sp.]|uniref:phosphoribosylanthranilate isomerase n=1 Tax=Desulfosporosinus sp. TaxID=157907 RepID=UPI0025BBD44C|nr:phosphoribosylanthranilate isomerase [Desulfosporosinus sp.]MBC2723225.1 phosphoribosylanthranilate isomerase [Desulfosporosinus sp.]MBC2729126.1 phosphoribosylanthranilate isomerase [Desulfosporosinus sp.]